MIDDTDLVARLRHDLVEHQEVMAVPPDLMASVRARSRQRRTRVMFLASAAAVLVAGAVTATALQGADRDATVTAGPGEGRPGPVWRGTVPSPSSVSSSTTVPPTTFPTGPPSQTPEAAARDGVQPELAALPFEARVQELARAEGGGQTWILSEGSDVTWAMAPDGAGTYGDAEGVYGTDFINTGEYGEVLLLGSGVPIVRAYPFPSLMPSWIHLTADAVYAGRLGDGGVPWHSLVRIDRDTLAAEVIVFQTPPDIVGRLDVALPGWRDATPAEVERYGSLVSHGPDAVGTRVATVWGPDGVIGVDIAGVEELFAKG